MLLAASGSKMRIWPSSLDIQIYCLVWFLDWILTSNLMRYMIINVYRTCTGFRPWANITALTLTSFIGRLGPPRFRICPLEATGQRHLCLRKIGAVAGLERWRNKIKNSTTTGLLLSYNLQIAFLVPSCTFIELYTCFQLQVVGVSTWNYAYPFIAVRVQASCTTTHELRLAVPMRKVYFVSIFKKQLRKLQIAMFKFQPIVLRGYLIQKPGFSCFCTLTPGRVFFFSNLWESNQQASTVHKNGRYKVGP